MTVVYVVFVVVSILKSCDTLRNVIH